MLRLLLLLLLTGSFSLYAVDETASSVGTLIVTYQTDEKGERLDSVRFWIRNDRYEQQMFPLGKGYVDDSENGTRMVVIEGLPVGKYEIEFLLPNGDGYFEEIPIREFSLGPEDAIRIEQNFRKKEA